MDANSPRSIIMFKIGDIVEAKNLTTKRRLIGFVESIVDGKVGVRYLNAHEFGIDNFHYELSVYTNPLDYLRKVDSIDERVEE
jgi:hypothetical protein